MSIMSPRRLDRAAEARWPGLFEYRHAYSPLYPAVAALIVACVLVLLGEPYSYGAAGAIGGALGLNIRVLIAARRDANARPAA